MRTINRRSTRWYRKNEEKVMKELGFKPTINSGAGWIEKEDGQSEHCICQLKSTDKQSIGVKLVDLNTLVKNASVSHKIPVFALQFIQTDDVWLLIRPEDLENIQDVAAGKEPKTVMHGFEDLLEESEENVTKYVDKNNEQSYNKGAMRNSIARKRYLEQQAKERTEREEKRKTKLKERKRAWRRDSNRRD